MVIVAAGAVMSAHAKGRIVDPARFTVSNVNVEKVGEQVEVTFDMQTERRASRNGFSIIYAPVITDGEHKVSLTPVVVRNRRAELSWLRHEWAAGMSPEPEGTFRMRNNDYLSYMSIVDFQPWMYNAYISAELLAAGCCTTEVYGSTLIATGIIGDEPEPEPVPTTVRVAVTAPPTTGENLAKSRPYVVPAAGWDRDTWGDRFEGDQESALNIYFKTSNSLIDRSYMDNGRTLDEIVSVINEITNSSDSRVTGIVVAGFSSPDGRFVYNDKLAWNRAIAVKEYIVKSTDVEASDVIVQNGSVDWYGFRRLVAEDRNMPNREKVLEIIDNNPVADSSTNSKRYTLLRNLDKTTYKYLLDNIFPELRRGSYIRVYFENK